ncbi:MAG: hypothetical protein AVDCRST_MAG56-1413 [uncultured Cytophagales bacterium]|uniref:Uncharacterized protein n=1 Tax=uncultured Cytophagales bacterium TaxID=158755 RepID=A0A6J4I416_9SPHI|nr:MAG: hypothetical protein AVDCRST_MAG56-1413 [uncultured Cytophagales bacterium]
MRSRTLNTKFLGPVPGRKELEAAGGGASGTFLRARGK